MKGNVVTVMFESPMTKDDLLAHFASALGITDWFGKNWDALDDVIRVSETTAPGGLVVVHKAYPVLETQCDNNAYMDILFESFEFWSAIGKKQLTVHLPLSAKTLLIERYGITRTEACDFQL